MLRPLKHQEKFVKGYKDKAFLVHEGGTGKTICACLWLRDGRDSDALVIAPKRVQTKWKKALKDWGTKATVVTTDGIKKMPIKLWSAIVVDESDEFASPLFTKGRSGRSTALYNLIKAQPDVPVLLATATPVRSNPWNLHTQLCYIGSYIDHKKWRSKFFTLEYRPYAPRPMYEPVKGWQKMMQPLIAKYADVVLLKDCVGELPPETFEIVNMLSEKYKSVELTPKARFVDTHQHEQKVKPKKIIELSKQYRKVLVVAYYVEQVEDLAKELSKDRQTFMVHGQTKNQEETLEEANKVDECFLVVQASLGAGFDADTFSCIIFASMSYTVRDWIQMKFRARRIHNLSPVHHIYLIAGKCDKAIYDTIQLGRDFVPSEYMNYDE